PGLLARSGGDAHDGKRRDRVQRPGTAVLTTKLKSVTVTRSDVVLRPDRTGVLVRPFHPSNRQRAANIGALVMALPDSVVATLLAQVEAEFGDRHVRVQDFLRRRFDQVRPMLRPASDISDPRKLLLGAYFTH